MGTFPLQMDFMATRMPLLCCISLSKTIINNNNRPTAPMTGPVGPVVKPSHCPRRVSTRKSAEPETGRATSQNLRENVFLHPGLLILTGYGGRDGTVSTRRAPPQF